MFGDTEPADAFDAAAARADPEQIAQRLYELDRLARLARGRPAGPHWAQLDPADRGLALEVVFGLVRWLAIQGVHL